MDPEANKIIEEQQKLMNKSPFLLIGFFLFFLADLVFFLVFQSNRLFMFNLNRSQENIPNLLITEVFSTVFYTIILIALIVYLIYLFIYMNKKYRTNHQVLKRIHGIADFFSVVPIFLFIVIIVNGFFLTLGQVDGESMQPNFCEHDTVVIIYNSKIENNDVLIIEYEESYLIKRLVGMPGDKLVVNDTGIYINDVLVESYIPHFLIEYNLIIPEGQYYFLGDNRSNSYDSRSIGLFSSDKILGKVVHNLSNKDCD
ncbi:MAG: signal peptidase I [Candidatus Izemoplasmatales bacterium]